MFGFDPFSRSSWISVKTILCKRVISTSMRIRLVLAITLLFVVYNFVTMGAPGYYLYGIGNSVAESIFGSDILGRVHGDYYWPIQIWMGLLWTIGACIIWCAMLVHKKDKRWSLGKHLLFPSALLAWDIILSTLFRVGAAAQSASSWIDVY